MINCLDCKYYSSNPYLRCAVNPTALGSCEMGEVGEPLPQLNADFSTQNSYPLYIDWHNGERINVNELTGLDRDLVLMGVPVVKLEEAKRGVESLAQTGVSYRGALIALNSILNNLGRLP